MNFYFQLHQPCISISRESVLAALPHLIELDHKGIPKHKDILQNNEEENSSEESDYEDCPELFQPLSTEKGIPIEGADFRCYINVKAKIFSSAMKKYF